MSRVLGLYNSLFKPKPKKSPAERWAERTVEKVRSAVLGGMFSFTPYLDNLTEETDEIRREYRTMLKEPFVKSSLFAKLFAVASLDFQVHPVDEDSPFDKEVAGFVRYNLERVNGGMPKTIFGMLAPAGIDGYSISEKVWDLEDRGKWRGKTVLKALKAKDKVRLVVDDFQNITAIRSLVGTELFEPRDFVIYSHNSIFENPIGMSDFRAAYRAVWAKKNVVNFRLVHLEKWTGPFLKGEYPEGDLSLKSALETALTNARSETWLTVPTGAAVDVIHAAASTTDYEKCIKDLNEEILIAIEGAFLQSITGQVADARGSSTVQRSRTELFQWMLSSAVAEALNKQLIPDLIDFNFPPNTNYPKVTLGMVSEADMIPALDIAERAQRIGVPLSKKAIARRFGLDMPIDASDQLQPPSAAPPAGGPAFPFREKSKSLPNLTPTKSKPI